ncbi:hypothetical protein NQ317_009162 [Molorchus minor]|uniref:C2H2-type domain-containing protein n=1 Tax=Molorchus minor TaxID=1323400 RepID=A0ABQ9K0V7_9CUCU|nr:hypothetical protein NQ317_009162 [Molorchus minor]
MAESVSVCRLACLEEHRMDFEIITDHTTVILNILCLKVDFNIVELMVCRSCVGSLDFNIVELMVCRSCVGSLVGYLTFATACATTEKKITKYCLRENFNGKELVDLNHVRMICKATENECEIFGKETLSGNINDVEMYTCETCQFKTKQKGNLKRHILVHREDYEVEMYTCEKCQYKTKKEGNLKKHLLVHRNSCEVEMYTCETCHFKTKHKSNLKAHLLVHRQSSEVETYTCETCQYKTKIKRSFKRHLLVHRKKV